MRRLGLAARTVLTAAALLVATGPHINAQPLPPDAAIVPPDTAELAEQVYAAGNADLTAAAIAAKSGEFADRMAALYFDHGSGPDWREEVARLHDPVRVSGLLLGAIGGLVSAPDFDADRIGPAIGASGVAARPNGRKNWLTARVLLGRMGAGDKAAARMQADPATLERIGKTIAAEELVTQAVSQRMNRDIAFARGFAGAEGFAFPTRMADIAADLILQLDELQAEEQARIELTLYAAFGARAAQNPGQLSFRQDDDAARALRSLMSRAEAEVVEQLATETGRAAARRLSGEAL